MKLLRLELNLETKNSRLRKDKTILKTGFQLQAEFSGECRNIVRVLSKLENAYLPGVKKNEKKYNGMEFERRIG